MTKPNDDLVALMNQIAADRDDVVAAGIELHRWRPNREGTAVEMFVRGAALPAQAYAQAYMDARYGERQVVVRHTDEPPGQRL